MTRCPNSFEMVTLTQKDALQLLVFIFSALNVVGNDEAEAIRYLHRFGYIEEDDNTTNNVIQLESGLLKLQEYYNLPVDGALNEETLRLIHAPRCGVKDEPLTLTRSVARWVKNNISWSFPLATRPALIDASRVFSIWQNYTNLFFNYVNTKPDISISFDTGKHKNSAGCQKGVCESDFDDEGFILAHAHFPRGDNCVEIHIDAAEKWYFGEDAKLPEGKISFFKVLLHEVGHSLGFAHTKDEESIMYGVYTNTPGKLSKHDISDIQRVYGLPKTTPATTPATSTTTMKKTGKINSSYPDLCSIRPEKILITSNHHMYIFYESWAWLIKVGSERYTKPHRIESYLNFSSFSHIYQRPSNDDILLIRDNLYYVLNFPSLRFVSDQGKPVEQLVRKGYNGFRINGMFTGYFGKTYIFYEDYYFVEIDECSLIPTHYGVISDKFPGIPARIDSVFRYINGNLYFIKNEMFYEFNEFRRKLLRFGEFDANLLGIDCSNNTNKDIVKKIKDLIGKINV